MSISQIATHEAPIASPAPEKGSVIPSAELLAPTSLELQFPNATQYDTFDTMMRCDAASSPDLRLIDPVLARDVLLDKLKQASDIRKRANACNPNDHITELQRFEAYYEGVDAYAGLIALAPSLKNGNDQVLHVFFEWAQLAAGAARQVEGQGASPSTTIFLTPTALASDWSSKSVARDTLSERARFERTGQYWAAAQQHNPTQIEKAFVGGDATRLNRAKALFHYAHELPEEDTSLKVACLEECVIVIHDAITNGERPHEDDLVGIYEHFMLESMLGRSVHDIVWLDGHDTEDNNHARVLSAQYLTNAADALTYVRDNLITAQVEPERDLHNDLVTFDGLVKNDPEMKDARKTIDFLASGLKELRDAQGALLNISNDPHRQRQGDAEWDVAEKRVAWLEAKTELEALEQKIEGQADVLRTRLDAIRADNNSITERLLTKRLNIIGDILPGTYGCRVAQLVLDIDQQIDEARYFATLYEAECKEGAQHQYELRQKLGASIVHFFEILKELGPNDPILDASRYHIPSTSTV